ncbi:NLP/P60 protein [Fictibacillus macauensis ZFHKF-1]|uniref:NLP/P60 protein n=1 Tax=Fictibacillus macauensis ZFHKF-1 TaxID=1196324 RepID=I8AL64_9BACL|nr:C40 family peptidase [Fictibacillus macauensis]EIT86349.1 NLP/P60 protein [Fictibacillus macauensis ZFHKF-1]
MKFRQFAGMLAAASLTLSFFSTDVLAFDSTHHTAYVDVAAATLWGTPSDARPLDQPSLTNPVDLRKWTTSMTYDEKLWLVGPLETQALYGNKVTITEEQGDWVKVAVDGQPTPRLATGYPGWMPKRQLTYSKSFRRMQDKPFVLVKHPTTWLFKDSKRKQADKEISYNTRLPITDVQGPTIGVMIPNGETRYIERAHIKIYFMKEAIQPPSPDELVNEGKKFIGLPYLWAGTSGFGFDCSGFTHTLYKAAGITIPRDSGPQSQGGQPVAKENLRKGDLLFFAYDQGKGKVHHVGMYAGDGKMIHSPNTSTTVRIDPIEGIYKEEFAGARRYLP